MRTCGRGRARSSRARRCARCRRGSSRRTSAFSASRTTLRSAMPRSRCSAKWVDSGAQRGNPADMPPPRSSLTGPNGASARLISSSRRPYDRQGRRSPTGTARADADGNAEERYVKAVEVHEVRVEQTAIEDAARASRTSTTPCSTMRASRRAHAPRDADGGPAAGDDASAGRGERFALTWCTKPARTPRFFLTSSASRLPAGSALTWRRASHSFGKDVPCGSRSPSSSTRRATAQIQAAGSVSMTHAHESDLDIPAGTRPSFARRLLRRRPSRRSITFEPHLHSSGKRMCVEAIYPNGFREIAELRRVQPQLGEDLQLRRRGGAAVARRDDHPYDCLVRQHERQHPVVDPRNWKGFGSRSIDDMSLMLAQDALSDTRGVQGGSRRAPRQEAAGRRVCTNPERVVDIDRPTPQGQEP